jgi:hypothetical protein
MSEFLIKGGKDTNHRVWLLMGMRWRPALGYVTSAKNVAQTPRP